METNQSIKSKFQSSSINLRLILICLLFLFIFFLILRSGLLTPSQQITSNSVLPSITISESPCPQIPLTRTCTKIPSSLTQALIHYATFNITPQQTPQEISVTARVLEKKSPCNFLVFGLGYDSLMWASLNQGGRTVFLEEDKHWIQNMKKQFPMLTSYHVEYDTLLPQADELMKVGLEKDCQVVTNPISSTCGLSLRNLPQEVYDLEWDLIMVDAPTGWQPIAPGRMKAIYTAGLIARNRESGETDVFVHDVNREVENNFSRTFLCEGYMVEQEGILRHFNIPSHRTIPGGPFCP